MKLLQLALFASLSMMLAGCPAKPTAPVTGAPGNTPATSAATFRIAVIPKGLGHDFWNKVRAGAEEAAAEQNALVLWNGPATEQDIAGQISILEGHVADRVDAIVIAACDAEALIEPIRKAIEAGIPVITIDSGVNSDLPQSLIATDNEKGAAMAADHIAELIGGEGEVGLIAFLKGAKTSDLRESGFKAGLKQHPGLKLVPVQYCNSQSDLAMNNTDAMLAAHPNLKAIFASNEPAAIGAAQALLIAGKAGKVILVAFDAAPSELQDLQAGTIQALIVQDPHRMGYEGVANAVRAIKGEKVEKRIDTGVVLVTQENLDDPDIQKLVQAASR